MNAQHKSIGKVVFDDVRGPYQKAGLPPKALFALIPADQADLIGDGSSVREPGKVLGRWDAVQGRWYGKTGDHFQNGYSDEQIREVANYPTNSMGIWGRVIPVIDSDTKTAGGRVIVARAVMEQQYGGLSEDQIWDAPRFAVRTRPKSHSRAYAFRPRQGQVIRSRNGAIRFKMAGSDVVETVEVKGATAHWQAEGGHKSGDTIGYEPGADLVSLFRDGKLIEQDEGDIDTSFETLRAMIEAIDPKTDKPFGEIVSFNDRVVGSGKGKRRSYLQSEPEHPVEAVFEALGRLPNDSEQFPTYSDFLAFTAKIIAVLGRMADDPDVMERYVEWAVSTAEGHAETVTEGWVEQKYQSFLRDGVDAAPYHFELALKDAGIQLDAKFDFPVITPEGQKKINAIISAGDAGIEANKAEIINGFADNYYIITQNIGDGVTFPIIRAKSLLGTELKADDVWASRAGDKDLQWIISALITSGYAKERWGLNHFVNDLRVARPDSIYSKTIKDVRRPIGEMVPYKDSQGNELFGLNLAPEPKSQELAKLPPSKNIAVRDQAAADLALFLDFVRRGFGSLAAFELNVMADTIQTGLRPGHMLYLVGKQGVGKSLYIDFCMRTLNGTYDDSPKGELLGSELLTDTRRRFALSNVAGCRGVNINEMSVVPRNERTQVATFFKQIVDPASKNNKVQIEKKGIDKGFVPNDFRVFMSSNYEDALPMEPGDRRTEYVSWGIDDTNHPGPEYFKELYDILEDDERLSTIVRYWLAKDTAGYDRTAKPPSSLAKIEAEILELDLDAPRHAEAALLKLKTDGRTIFDLREFAHIMTAMGELEFKNTGGERGGRPPKRYSFKAPDKVMREVLNHVARQSSALQPMKSGGNNLPKIYVMKNDDGTVSKRVRELNGSKPRVVVDGIEQDRKDHPFGEYHPIEQFAGPVPPMSREPVNDNADVAASSDTPRRREA